MPRKEPGNRYLPWIFSVAEALVSARFGVPGEFYDFFPVCLQSAFYTGCFGQNAVADECGDAVFEPGMVGRRTGMWTDCQSIRPEAVDGLRRPVSGRWRWNHGHVFSRHFLNGLFCRFGIRRNGYGFVSMATLLVVQDSLDKSDLGVATASHQFSRTLGGTIGVGISGSFVTMALSNVMESLLNTNLNNLPPSLNVDDKTEH